MSTSEHEAVLNQDLFSDDTVRLMAVLRAITLIDEVSMSRLDLPCASRLVELNGHSAEMVRVGSAEALECGLPVHADEVPRLCELLADQQHGDVSYWAATLLGRCGAAGGLGCHWAEAIMALESCLTDSHFLPTRERAAWALGRIGQKAAGAMPVLRNIAEDAPPRLRRLAIEALESIRGFAA
ncbi:HEAT repeat domain-containing protein [Crateriforma conspicua]|uniref:HEAT repeat protein n=1 Tax=Crateriforma conspicua TaxID=2527996 RepID=A0A5C5Y6C2_9PLAN|nr:HEAT repeat domain-containing protein [Crateriforma conspicua]QDV65091.1 hypothetical protein Mal65_42600 [Crateriforma conspicua]TWT70488.1 hypothetical protein Pan14r_27940 [Crateriforma conspicua]